jgi:hypothetical protein
MMTLLVDFNLRLTSEAIPFSGRRRRSTIHTVSFFELFFGFPFKLALRTSLGHDG